MQGRELGALGQRCSSLEPTAPPAAGQQLRDTTLQGVSRSLALPSSLGLPQELHPQAMTPVHVHPTCCQQALQAKIPGSADKSLISERESWWKSASLIKAQALTQVAVQELD